jgi:hypothetical protein
MLSRPAAALPEATTAAVWENAVDLAGVLLLTPQTGAVDLRAEGTAFPDLFCASWLPRLGLPESDIVRGIHCAAGSPAHLVLSASRPDRRQPPRLQAAVSAQDVRYLDLEFRTVQGNLELSPKTLSFSDLRGTTVAGEELSVGHLQIDFEPLAVIIRKGRVVGNPNLGATFIDAPQAKRIYRAVWEDFRWPADHPAVIDLRELAYRQSPGGHAWELTLDATLQALQASYRDLPVTRLDANVLLALPGSVTVRDARVQTESATVEGEVTILVGDNPKCSFELRQQQGGQDPRRVLHALNPEWDGMLAPLTFSPQSALDCRGSFYLSREPRLQVSGSLRTPYLEFHGLRVADPDLRWRLSEAALHWDIRSGKLFGGNLALTGAYDVDTGAGTVALRGEAMEFKQIATRIGLKDPEAAPGLVSAHSRLQILRGWAGRDLQVYGDANLTLAQADIWRVPIFDPLGRLLDVSFLSRITGGKAVGLGRITRLDADLGFTGDRVAIRSLRTDGTILSLRGRGEYCWETDRIYLAVTGQTLDNAGIVGWIFRPLSWAFFNAELTGTSKDSKWRLSNAFSKAIPGNSATGSADDSPSLLLEP